MYASNNTAPKHEAKTGRNGEINNNNSCRLQYPIFNNG